MAWGALTMILGAIQNFAGVTVVRFFLGAFEAGLFPGLIYCTTFWYKQNERGLRVSLVSAVATLGELISLGMSQRVKHTEADNRRSVRRRHCLRRRRWLERHTRSSRLEMALYS